MKIVFCCDPTSHDNPDSMYIDEVAAATHAGMQFVLIDYEALTEKNNAARAVRDVPVHKTLESAVYRGWSLTLAQYDALYNALRSRGIQLINNAKQFRSTQYLPDYYPIIKDKTPQTVYMETDGKHIVYDAVQQLLLPFSGQSMILRDYARAEKHYWTQACYIESANDSAEVRKTIDFFLRLRGKNLEGGLVFREFVDFELLVEDTVSSTGMPLIKDYRIFYLNGLPIATIHYWNIEDDDETDEPDLEQFTSLAQQVRSRFFTIDVAKRSGDGTWSIIDLGDAQVATLPISADLDSIYRTLAESQ